MPPGELGVAKLSLLRRRSVSGFLSNLGMPNPSAPTPAGAVTADEPGDRFFAISIDLLCYLDFSGYFRRVNPAWERALGFTTAELMAQPFIEFVHPDDRERTLVQNRAVREGGQALGFENRYRCKDGSYRWLHWNAASDVGHGVICAVARDVTAAKAAAEERERLVQELQHALAEVKSLRAIIPICSYCRKVRDDENYWQHVEQYIAAHTGSKFSHGVCPTCYAREIEPELNKFEQRDQQDQAP